tara:strand:+ start:276 stop:461 length:186 start_codon:yes stop_codon:yes gene_type:complete
MAKGRVYQHDKRNRFLPHEGGKGFGNFSHFQLQGNHYSQKKCRKSAPKYVPVRKIFGEVIK